jgi:hypothetical protein
VTGRELPFIYMDADADVCMLVFIGEPWPGRKPIP